MEEINFITIGDENFFPLVNFSAKQIFRLYPNSKFFIYDWGFTISQKRILKSFKNIILVNWLNKINRRTGYKAIEFNHEKYESDTNFKQLEYLYMQKPLCILDCAKRINKNLIYLDGDAFLINRIDEIFNFEFDIGVTIRIEDKIIEIAKFKGFRAEINAGIIFFNTDSKKIQLFILKWIDEIQNTKQLWIEQTALNNLIVRNNKNIFNEYYNTGIVKISNLEFKVKTFPCTLYNHYMIDEGYNPKEHKILHIRPIEGKINKQSIGDFITVIKIGPVYNNLLNLVPKRLRKFIKNIFNIFFLANFIKNPLKIKKWLNQLLKPFRIRYLKSI